MIFQKKIIEAVGQDVFNKLHKLAEEEVGQAMEMELEDKLAHRKNYYTRKHPLHLLKSECDIFQKADLKIMPTDIIYALFEAQLAHAVGDENEFRQRSGGGFPGIQYIKEKDLASTITKKLECLRKNIEKRTLLVNISCFDTGGDDIQKFFEENIKSIHKDFVCFFEGKHLMHLYKNLNPGHISYKKKMATDFFNAPSVGFSIKGSEAYCYYYASSWLRTLLHLIRIIGFIKPPQIGGGAQIKGLWAPTTPVFLGTGSRGGFSWNEDKKLPWMRIPDGCLFNSFGYRALSNMWLDKRTHASITKFLKDQKKIFKYLKNPWSPPCTVDIAPIMELLSSSIQVPDLGAKILLQYTCLEHLFVPNGTKKHNREYIVGGLTALSPDLNAWFAELYKLRCEYAHKGFILNSEKSLGIAITSVNNILQLLQAKLAASTM